MVEVDLNMQADVEQKPDLGRIKEVVREAGEKGVHRGMVRFQNGAATIIRAERFATGHLAQSLHNETMADGNTITGTMQPEAPYAPFVELDTRPHIAPMAAFLPWATVKGFRATGQSFRRGTPEHNGLAIAGWLAVKHRGTKGIHYMKRSFDANHDEAVNDVKQAIQGAIGGAS